MRIHTAPLLVLVSLAVVLWGSSPAPGPASPARPAPVPLAALEVAPEGVAPDRPRAHRASPGASRAAGPASAIVAPERPRWPSDWPDLDAGPVGAPFSGVQTMGSGAIDVEVPGASDLAGDEDDAEDEEIEFFVPPFAEPAEGADDAGAEEEVDRRIEELGEMIRRRRTGEDAPRDEDDADAEDEEIEFFVPPFPQPAEGADDVPTDEEVVRGLDEIGDMIRRIRGANDDPIDDRGEDPPGDDAGPGAGETLRTVPRDPPPSDDAGPGDAADDGPGDAPAAASEPATGFLFQSPDGRPIDVVTLGEPFFVELHVLPDEAGVPGRAGGLRDLDFMDVTFRTEEGGEETVRLVRLDEPTPDGLVRYASEEAVVIGGRRTDNVREPGTVDDLGLDFGGSIGSQIVRIQVPGYASHMTGGFTILEVWGDAISRGIAEVAGALDRVEEYLNAEREAVETLLADAEAQGFDDAAEVLRHTLARIRSQFIVLEKARQIMRDEPLPVYKFRLGKWLLDKLVEQTPNGLVVKDKDPRNITGNRIETLDALLAPERKRLDDAYGTHGKIVPQAMIDVVSGYVVGMYSMFAHVTMAAPVLTLITGQNEFGEEASRGWALVEIGMGVAMLRLPGKVIDMVAEGRLVPSVDIRVPTFRRGAAGGEPLPARPGRLAAETAGGQRPYPGRGRRGLDGDEIRRWRDRERPSSDEGIADFNEKIASMDEAVATARQRGVPDEVIDDVLARARDNPSLGTAEPFVTQKLEWEIAIRSRERIVLSADEAAQLRFEASAPDAAATPAQIGGATILDKVALENVIAKSHLEAAGKPQRWTVDELEVGRSVVRRLEAGEDVAAWKTVELDEGSGLRPLFGSDDLGAIRSTFTGRPLRVVTEAPPPTTRGGSRAPGAGAAEDGVVTQAPARGIAEDGVVTQAPARAGGIAEDGVVTQPPARAGGIADDGVVTQPPPGRRVDPGAETQPVTERMTPAERAAALDEAAPSRAAPVDQAAPTERIGRAPEAPTPAADAPPSAPSDRSIAVIDPVVEPAAFGGPSGRPGVDGIEVVVRSRGGSTGKGVLEAFFVNHGDAPVRIRGAGLVLEPFDLTQENSARVAEILDAASSGKRLTPPGGEDREARSGARTGAGPMPFPAEWRGASVVRVELEGYCLELAEGVPTEGTVFRIADASTQAAHASLRAILESSRALHEEGRLHPDVDPETYHHSIRQWAIWVDENGFDRTGFEEAFVAHARRNLEAAGRAWDDRTEGVVRSLAPGRWQDVVAVLTEAGLAVAAGDQS